MSTETIFELQRMYKSYRLIIFITTFWHIILLAMICLYIYIRYFHTKRIRWFNTAIMIKLEPENIEYCQKIAKFFTNYKINARNKFSYEPLIDENIYFHETKMTQFVETMNKIESEVFKHKSINIAEIDLEREDDYTDTVAKLVNSDFNWSVSDKFKKTRNTKIPIENFFKYLKELTKKTYSNTFEKFIENDSIFNFLDLDNLFLDDIKQLTENKLIVKYGNYTGTAIKDIILDINQTYKNENVETFLKENANDGVLKDTLQLPIEELLEEMVKQIKGVLFKFYGIDERYYQYFMNGITTEAKSKCLEKDMNEKDFGEENDNFTNAMTLLQTIEQFKDLYKDSEHFEKFKGEYYILMERLLYATFDSNTQRNVFSPNKANTILTIYQNVVDYIIYIEKKDIIDLAIRFTIHHFVNTDKNKTENIQNIAELYISMNELFLMNNTYKEVLDEYNIKRKPSIKELKKLYMDSIKNKTNYFIIDGIVNQWKTLVKFKQPPRYEWLLKPFVDYMKSVSILSILKWVINIKEDFTEEIEPEKEQITENFGNPFKALSKPFKAIAKFLKEALKIVKFIISFITNPFNFIAFIVKFILAVFMISIKLVLFTIKIGSVYPGEMLLYFVVLIIGSILNITLYVYIITLIVIMMFFDTYLTHGLIYRFIYWMFGANENSPSAWYKHSGYHYGYDLCKKEGSTQCNGYYQNKVKRMFLAYYRCGDNYKPDRETKGFMCSRKYEQEPGYCLQSNIYRLYNNMTPAIPYTPGPFVPTIEYLQSTEKQRKKQQNKFKTMKHNFYNNCNATMQPFDPLSKNICRVYSGVSNNNSSAMESFCYNTYCKNGNREPFCYKMANNFTSKNNNGPSGSEILTRMFTLTIYFVILAYLINVFLETKMVDPNA